MLFGRRDKDKKKPNDRVLDLKARVDALRAADEASRSKAYTLDHFLEGDDVLTGREVEDEYKPTGFSAADEPATTDDHFEVNLQAELEKYLKRQEELGQANENAAATLPAPPQPAQSEPASFLLDGTWSRDGAARQPAAPPPAEPAAAWPGEDATWSSPSDQSAGLSAFSMEGDPPASAWPSSRDLPPERDWPPREDEAV